MPSDQTKESPYREHVSFLQQNTLARLWEKGMRGRALVGQHSELVDRTIQTSFYNADPPGSMAVIATGGYGRRELFPFSDVDLLVLYDRKSAKEIAGVVDKVLYPLWDSGMAVGHSVRTKKECLIDAKKDFHFQVSLLDARVVCGSKELFQEIKDALDNDVLAPNRSIFFDKICDERALRLARFGLHAHMLEPNIKESRGGFRDLHTLLWTAKVIFGFHGVAAMEEAGLLTAEERWECEDAWEEMVRIRNRLHYISKRKNDQLFFEHQEKMSTAFGFVDTDQSLAVEQFMRRVHGCMKSVAFVTELFLEHTQEVLLRIDAARKGKTMHTSRLTLSGLDLASGGTTIMSLFHKAASTGVGIHHQTKKLIRSNLHLVDEKFRKSKKNAKLFLQILTTAEDPLPTLDVMLDCGFLPAYLPEFSPILSLPQHDVYHVYTVDIHLLHTVAELCVMRKEFSHIFEKTDLAPELFLAALLHDVGKGHGSGHAARGAPLALQAGKRLGLDEAACSRLQFLVGEHLFLSDMATRRDLEDEQTVKACAQHVPRETLLAMLYLLSVADARATGPQAWNRWKGALLQELYLRTANILLHEEYRHDRKGGANWMRQELSSVLGEKIPVHYDLLPDDYLLSFTPDEAAAHLRKLPELGQSPLVLIPEQTSSPDVWTLTIIARDKPGFLAGICGVLTLHNLSVLDAKIFTWQDGTVVDVLSVTTTHGYDFDRMDWAGAIATDMHIAMEDRQVIRRRLLSKPAPIGEKRRMTPRRDDRVIVDNTSSQECTVVEVHAANRMGLLYDLAATIADFGLSIKRAKISTNGDLAVDVFYVCTEGGKKLADPVRLQELEQKILQSININRGAPLQHGVSC